MISLTVHVIVFGASDSGKKGIDTIYSGIYFCSVDTMLAVAMRHLLWLLRLLRYTLFLFEETVLTAASQCGLEVKTSRQINKLLG